jgi:nitroreductase
MEDAMRLKHTAAVLSVMTAILIYSAALYAEDIKPISLPNPQTFGGKPLMQALKERKSMRSFSAKELPLQAMSDMLWAARGINRPDTGGLTAPTAKNRQEIDVYVVKAEGVYLYDAKANMLAPVLTGDIRAVTGSQPFVKDAPVNLVFVADLLKMDGMDAALADFYAATDTGYISQNVYLYCASVGLATVVRGWVDKPALEKAMRLRSDQKVILAQTVGYPNE